MALHLLSKVSQITKPFIPKNCKDCSTPYTILLKLSNNIFIPLFCDKLRGDLIQYNCGFNDINDIVRYCKQYDTKSTFLNYIWQVYLGDKLISTFIDLFLALEYIRLQNNFKIIMPKFYIRKNNLCAEFNFGDYYLYPRLINYLNYKSKYTCISTL